MDAGELAATATADATLDPGGVLEVREEDHTPAPGSPAAGAVPAVRGAFGK
jgi:hypothetical protein